MPKKYLTLFVVGYIFLFPSLGWSLDNGGQPQVNAPNQKVAAPNDVFMDKKYKKNRKNNNPDDPENLRGVTKIFPGMYYVSPIMVSIEDQKKIKNRFNTYFVAYVGPVLTFRTSSMPADAQSRVFTNLDIGVGFDLILNHFYLGFGVEMYNLFGSGSGSDLEYMLGYKFKFMIGGVIIPKKGPITKVYLLYRDNQLQVDVNNRKSDIFGYYSRNIGFGFASQVVKGLEVGAEAFFSLMHADSVDVVQTPNYPLLGLQGFVKVTF